ncbi:dynein regulatory complex protein 11-like isoform X2 [Leptidea sinapis]|uniref:dynein regulatory complex protein 11-like isoform X2 n=1 Tax=Leptidea sinapis TaxID=189913 RepID=UPI002146833F|nr:dynein regulatory complex protein 11-like isoform X2 [Leptidea sinapis]
MPLLQYPIRLPTIQESHKKWMKMLEEAQTLVKDDQDLQVKSAAGFWIKTRALPPEVLGRLYTQYCVLINNMYDAYLVSVHLQRAPYILEIISILMKRLYELRNELVHLIVNDYIYVDEALIQSAKTPFDIQIVVPYHVPLECRTDSMETFLQRMWLDAEIRKNNPIQKDERHTPEEEFLMRIASSSDTKVVEKAPSEPLVMPESYIQAVYIQKQERFRQFFIVDFKAKCNKRKTFFLDPDAEAPLDLREKAAARIQFIYRRFMEIKRQRELEIKRDILLGIIKDPFKKRLNLEEENNKMYERKRIVQENIKETYMRQLERDRDRLIVLKRDNQIDDITDQVRSWLKEWYYGYGYFPEYPYPLEGGTVVVIRGDYPTIEEKIEMDEKYIARTKGKTKEQIKEEKQKAKLDEKMKQLAERDKERKDGEQLFKLRCNPLTDPGYKPTKSHVIGDVVEVLQKYFAAWSIYDKFPPNHPETVYGYMDQVLTEDIMAQMHLDCRKIVDEMMRLELKVLNKAQQHMFKISGLKMPKLEPRKKPQPLKKPPMPMILDDKLTHELKELFDLQLLSKPQSKIKDIFGDYKYAAYDFNIMDPIAKFPPPGYGDVKRRLTLSCVFGLGIQPGAPRNKAVLLVGPEKNGKSFLADTVAGEANAVKIDISPEVFSAKTGTPGKLMTTVLVAARLFQPAIIFMKNIERVFRTKVPAEERYLMAKNVRNPLVKLIKQINEDDKIMFIATCTNPFDIQAKPMVSLFNEMLLVPRTDYNSLRDFFYESFQRSIRNTWTSL